MSRFAVTLLLALSTTAGSLQSQGNSGLKGRPDANPSETRKYLQSLGWGDDYPADAVVDTLYEWGANAVRVRIVPMRAANQVDWKKALGIGGPGGNGHFVAKIYNLEEKDIDPLGLEKLGTGYLWIGEVEADGSRVGIIAHGYDVTQHVLTRREVERAKEMAESANRAKSDFLAVMSHELRTPLNAIGGYAELLELGVHGPITREQRQALDRIQRSQRHLLGLINGVLNYTRVEAGVVHYDLERVSVADAIASCEALIAPQMNSKKLKFEWTVSENTLTVHADREKLQQILLNLLSNAIKFTDQGGSIGIESDETSGVIRIAVSDTGRGIADDQIASVFEPFVQVDSTFTRSQEGVGLGLALSRDLARGMGGDLTLASVLGVGSTFTLKLPAIN